MALDMETEPIRAAALLSRAQRLVDKLGAAIVQEVKKRTPKPPKGPKAPPEPMREIRRVRFSDVATIRRVRIEAEWEELQQKFDHRVRTLLREFEVEFD